MINREKERELLSNPVRDLQFMLGRLADRYDFLPALSLDGLFGEETLEAVLLFQRELAPPVTGVVDERTWNAFGTSGSSWSGRPPRPGPEDFPRRGDQAVPGASGNYMILPQTMFQVLRQKLSGIQEDAADGVHGKSSVENTMWLQKLAQLEQTGIMDGHLGYAQSVV